MSESNENMNGEKNKDNRGISNTNKKKMKTNNQQRNHKLNNRFNSKLLRKLGSVILGNFRISMFLPEEKLPMIKKMKFQKHHKLIWTLMLSQLQMEEQHR